MLVPGENEATSLFGRLIHEAWAWGWKHGRQETAGFPREFSAFNLPPPDNTAPIPTDAVAWMRGRQAMLGKWNRDLDAAVTQILAQAIETGATLDETVKALRGVFPDFGRQRLENIVRTETTAAYNRGLLRQFQEPGSQVAAVQFAAVLDANTTPICRHRDGLIMRMDDERLLENTPPLHFNCRSILVPLSHRDMRRLADGHKLTEERIFGWVPDGGPKSLAEAEMRWKAVEPPQKGFGLVDAVAKVKPKPAAPAPAPVPPPAPEKPKVPRKKASAAAKAMKAKEHKAAIKAATTAEQKLDAVLTAGKDVITYVKGQLGDDFAKLEAQMEAKKAAYDTSTDAVEKARSKKKGSMDEILVALREQHKASNEWEAAFKEVATRRQEAVTAALSEFRKLGPKVELADDSQLVAAKTIEGITRLFPEAWGKAATKLPKHQRKFQATILSRGEYQHGDKRVIGGNSRIAILMREETRSKVALSMREFQRGGMEAVAAHEMQHRWDFTNPLLHQVAEAFLERRTAGESLERMRDLFPGMNYSPGEVVKKDKFAHPYVGRVYGIPATEVNTVGVEGLFWNLYDIWNKDPEHLEYIAGVLAVL